MLTRNEQQQQQKKTFEPLFITRENSDFLCCHIKCQASQSFFFLSLYLIFFFILYPFTACIADFEVWTFYLDLLEMWKLCLIFPSLCFKFIHTDNTHIISNMSWFNSMYILHEIKWFNNVNKPLFFILSNKWIGILLF